MAAGVTKKGLATRSRIVEAAAAAILDRGVDRTSLDDVKSSAGVSSSQLYHYFVDKQALVLAVIEYQSDAILEAQKPLLGSLDSVAALRKWRDLLVGVQDQMQCRGGCPIGTIAAQVAETDPEARASVAAGLRRWETAICDGLRAMHGRGELAGDPDQLALALMAALEGGALLTQVRRESSPLAAALDIAIDHIEILNTGPT